MTPHGLSSSNPILSAGLIPTTSVDAEMVSIALEFWSLVQPRTDYNISTTTIRQLFYSFIETFPVILEVPGFSAQ